MGAASSHHCTLTTEGRRPLTTAKATATACRSVSHSPTVLAHCALHAPPGHLNQAKALDSRFRAWQGAVPVPFEATQTNDIAGDKCYVKPQTTTVAAATQTTDSGWSDGYTVAIVAGSVATVAGLSAAAYTSFGATRSQSVDQASLL